MKCSEIRRLLLIISMIVIPGFSMAGPPDWSVNPADYQYTGSVTSAVYRDLMDVGSAGDMLGAFVGDQCRGVVGAWQTPGSNYVFPLTVNSNEAAGEFLAFRYYDAGMEVVCHIQEQVEFTADMIVGSLASPVQMHIDGYQPFPPSNPVPCSTCWQDTIETIAWDGGDPDVGDTVVYYVYLGTETDPPIYDTTAAYPGSTTEITYNLPPLLGGLIYRWRVVAEDKQGMTTSGPVWIFVMGQNATEPTRWGRIKMLFE